MTHPHRSLVPRRRSIAAYTCACCCLAASPAFSNEPPIAPSSPSAQPTATSTSAPTFTRDIAPIIFQNCSSCHHPGEAAPFSLLSYEDARRRSRQIADLTHSRFMPPWLPTQGRDTFLGARTLTDVELETIKAWADAGAPQGNPADMPPTPTFIEGWDAGTPDLILESPPYALPADGRDVFRNFVIPVTLDTARWVQSIELRPVNPRVTHHARLGVDSSNESVRRDAEDPEPGYDGMAWGQDPDGQLVIWAPGMVAAPPTPGVAWRLVPKSTLVLHTHMQPSGKPETVRFRIGIRFADTSPERSPAMLRIGPCDIDIPANAPDHKASDQYTLPVDVNVHTIFPHAHSLCQKLSVTAERPDGSRTTLISIDHFDENWHDSYRFVSPVRLAKGTRLLTSFTYDNSSNNPKNRNTPPKRTGYGSSVTDEMADVYLQVTAVQPDQRAVLMENYKRYELQSQVLGFRKSLELTPENPWSQEALATCYVGLGRPGDAVSILEKRLASGPKAVFPLVSLAMAQLALGDLTSAESQFREALTMDDQYPLAWFGLGSTLARQRSSDQAARSQEAEKALRRAVELAPGLADAHLQLADLLIQRGQLAEAERICTQALAGSPDIPAISIKLAEISARSGSDAQALDKYALARRTAPYTHPPKVLLAVFCYSNNRAEDAIKLLSEAKSESPDYPIPPLILGQIAIQREQWKQADELFSAAAALPIPENWPESHRQRFTMLLRSERAKLAPHLAP